MEKTASENKRDVVFDLAENIAATGYHDLSPQDVEATKRSVLDTLGTLAAGSPEPPFKQLVAYLLDEGGKPESTIMVYGGKVPARNAVLANSSMARALDLDDANPSAYVHPSVNTVPTAFAVAERQGAVSGEDLITSIALGADLMIRISLACKTLPAERGRMPSLLFSTFASAAVTSKLLGFDVNKTADALGNAYLRTAGSAVAYYDGAIAQRVHQGVAAGAGVLAATLAQIGIGGCKNTLEGRGGYYPTYENGEYNREALTDSLGKKFWGTTNLFKRFSNGAHMHPAMDGTLAIVTENDLKPSEIDRITVRYPAAFEGAFTSTGIFLPERTDPTGPVEPHFSMAWAIGLAAVKRQALMEDFTEEGVKKNRDAVVPVARKVESVADPGLQRVPGSIGPVVVEIQARGRTYSKQVDYQKGSPQNPLTWAELVQKFRNCVSRAAKPLPHRNTEQIIEMVSDLEKIKDVTRIIRLMS